MNEVLNFLNNLNINKQDTLVVAVSHGPDSMALLDVLRKLFCENKIVCAHVHHNHRKQSDEEAELLKKYCLDHNVIFEINKIEKYTNDKFTEEEAREKRYQFFDKLMNKYHSKYLFTAHHGDDLIETVLMKIVRSSTLSGYQGISLISNREKYQIVRPFLFITKDEIIKYCNQFEINYSIDLSNNDIKYTRNRYRKTILPFLKKEDKNVHRKFLTFSKTLKEYENYIDKVVLKVYDKVICNNEISIKELEYQEELILKKVIQKYLFNNYGEKISLLTNKHTDQILTMIKSNKNNIKLSLPLKKTLIKDYNKIYFAKDVTYNDYCFVLNDYIELENGYVIKKLDKLGSNSNYFSAFSSNEVTLPLYVRNKLDGDKISVLGMNGSKKIKDIFIDEKISAECRNNYPVVVDSDGKVLWLPGLKKSKYDKSKTGKYDIILGYYREENYNATK